MSVQSRSWSLRARPRGGVAAAAFAIVLFFASWALLHEGWFKRGQIVDTPVYQQYGDAMARGEVPYRDFSVEYPPGALPAFVLPALGHAGDEPAFRQSFETPKPITANEPLLYRWTLPTANHVFLPGHRLMVQVQSSWFPLYDRNPQTFVNNIFWAKPGDYKKATQRIYHAPTNASFVELPLVTKP